MLNLIAVLKNKSGFKITKHAAKKLDFRCELFESAKFLNFLQTKQHGQQSYLDAINEVYKNLRPITFYEQRQTKKDIQDIKTSVKGFFETYLPKKANEANQILDGTHPLFLDKKGKTKVHITKSYRPWRKDLSSSVAYIPGDSFLRLNIYLLGSFEDYTTTAHELAHSLSAIVQSYPKNAKNIEENIDKDLDEEFFKTDSAGEIESLICEYLYLDYVQQTKQFSAKDVQEHKLSLDDSLYHYAKLISEEQQIVSKLDFPITQQGLTNLYNFYKQQGNQKLVYRIRKMCQGGITEHNSVYIFRYFVGHIVASEWIKQYSNSTQVQKQKMLDVYQDYLGKTDTLEMEDACQMLLGKSFEKIATQYISDLKKQNQENQERAKQIMDKFKQTYGLEDKNMTLKLK
ncbi:MAG: hypothetical protein IJU58_00850 [Clostridia bacterium]|nr:hypothetical protein [Clostridia bacterium]